MKVDELMHDNVFDTGKAMNAEMRDLAKSIDVSWADMVGFVKPGAWYGGTIASVGGARGQKKSMFTFEQRLRMFFKVLTKHLGELIDQGHTVTVLPNSDANGKPQATTKEQLSSLFDSVNVRIVSGREDNPYARCRWFISWSEEQAKGKVLRLDMHVVNRGRDWQWGGIVYTAVTEEIHKDVRAKMRAIVREPLIMSKMVADAMVLWQQSGGVHKKTGTVGSWSSTFEQAHELAKNPDTTPEKGHFGVVKIAGQVLPQGAVKVPQLYLLEIINRWAKKVAP